MWNVGKGQGRKDDRKVFRKLTAMQFPFLLLPMSCVRQLSAPRVITTRIVIAKLDKAISESLFKDGYPSIGSPYLSLAPKPTWVKLILLPPKHTWKSLPLSRMFRTLSLAGVALTPAPLQLVVWWAPQGSTWNVSVYDEDIQCNKDVVVYEWKQWVDVSIRCQRLKLRDLSSRLFSGFSEPN